MARLAGMTPQQQHVSDEFLRIRPRLTAYAVSLTRDPDRAEDLVADVYLRALENADRYEPGTVFAAWAFTMMRNYWISYTRTLKHKILNHVELTVPDLPAVEPVQDGRLELLDVLRMMMRLPEQRRRLMLMVGLEGMSQREIADRLGMNEITVRTAVFKARAKLKKEGAV